MSESEKKIPATLSDFRTNQLFTKSLWDSHLRTFFRVISDFFKIFRSLSEKKLLESGAEHPTKLNSVSKLATNHQRDYYYQSPRSLTPKAGDDVAAAAAAAATQHYATTPTRAPSAGGKKSIPATTATASARQRKQVRVCVSACEKACVSVCECVREGVCASVCECVCVWGKCCSTALSVGCASRVIFFRSQRKQAVAGILSKQLTRF